MGTGFKFKKVISTQNLYKVFQYEIGFYRSSMACARARGALICAGPGRHMGKAGFREAGAVVLLHKCSCELCEAHDNIILFHHASAFTLPHKLPCPQFSAVAVLSAGSCELHARIIVY
jgi:hypothetical protein